MLELTARPLRASSPTVSPALLSIVSMAAPYGAPPGRDGFMMDSANWETRHIMLARPTNSTKTAHALSYPPIDRPPSGRRSPPPLFSGRHPAWEKPPFHTGGGKPASLPTPSYNNAANESDAVVLAEKVQRDANERQFRIAQE